MSIERVKKASNSFKWMMILLSISSVVPFVIRTVMIRYLGEDYVGINSLFMSILQVLSISELGMNEALVYYLYKPMAEKDIKKANELLNLYKSVFRVIGICVLVISVILIPFLPHFIDGDIPSDVNIYYLYSIYVINLLISYTYKNYCLSIFQTNQSLYYKYKSETFICIGMYVVQIISLIVFRNYYGYAIMIPAETIALNTALWFLSKKHYPEYKPEGKPDKSFYPDFWKKVVAMAFMKFRNVFRNSIDSIVISSFLGLAMLAKFNNYYMVLIIAGMLINVFSQSMLQSLGNSVAMESVESNRGVIKMFSFLLQAVTLVIGAGMMCLYNCFITLWIGEKYTFPILTVVLFVAYFYLIQIASLSNLIRNSTGVWTKGKWIPLVETLLNLILDIVLVKYFKQNGILMGTIISLVIINIPFETAVVFREYFKEKPFKVLGDYLFNGIVAAGIMYICYKVTGSFMNEVGIVSFVVKGIVCVAISVSLFCLVHIRDSRLYDLIQIVKSILVKEK